MSFTSTRAARNEQVFGLVDPVTLNDSSISSYYKSEASEVAHEIGIMNQLKGTTNIVSLEDHQMVPHEDGIGYDILIRMELLTSLDKYISERGFSRDDVIRLGIDLCSGLERCRKVGIIHRDIKPANIFVSKLGDFKLGDFGIARIAEKTQAGMSRNAEQEAVLEVLPFLPPIIVLASIAV